MWTSKENCRRSLKMKKKKKAEVKVVIQAHRYHYLHRGKTDCHRMCRFLSDEDEDMSRETTGEPEMEHIPSSSILEAPTSSRRRTMSAGQSPTESRATESQAERPVSEECPLTETWRRTGTTGPGVDLAGRCFDQTN